MKTDMTPHEALKMVARSEFLLFNDADLKAFPGIRNDDALIADLNQDTVIIDEGYVEIYVKTFLGEKIFQFKMTLAQ